MLLLDTSEDISWSKCWFNVNLKFSHWAVFLGRSIKSLWWFYASLFWGHFFILTQKDLFFPFTWHSGLTLPIIWKMQWGSHLIIDFHCWKRKTHSRLLICSDCSHTDVYNRSMMAVRSPTPNIYRTTLNTSSDLSHWCAEAAKSLMPIQAKSGNEKHSLLPLFIHRPQPWSSAATGT